MPVLNTTLGARLGIATLALTLQLANPLASSTALAQTAATPPAPAPAPAATAPATATSNGSSGSGCADPGPKDYPVAGGWFYTEEARGLCIHGAGPDRNRGYLVLDDDKGAFWTEFRRYGGVDVLGYPVSQPYHYPANNDGGYWYQAFERGVLQWRPELGRADMANVFEQFTEQGLDDDLAVLGIPGPRTLDDRSTLGAEINDRMSWLTEPRFLARFFFDPVAAHSSEPSRDGQSAFTTQEQAWSFFGLPQSMPERLTLVGPGRQSLYPLVHSFMAQRFQKAGMQLFFEDVANEKFQSPTWTDIPVSLDPTVVPGDGRKGCVALTAVGLLARSIGADKLIPSTALEPRPLDPSPRPSVQWFVPQVAPGQFMTSFQLMGTGFAANEPITIRLTDPSVPGTASGAATAGTLPPVVSHVTANRDGSFDAIVTARVGTYQLVASGDQSQQMFIDRVDLTIPSGIYVDTLAGASQSGSGCRPVGLPIGN